MNKEHNIIADTILKPQITVFGVGGAGGNATNNMINKNLEGANFVVANTDAQALEHSVSPHRVQLGRDTTKGLGAGASPEVGKYAAEETGEEIMEHLRGSNMVFITAGMGGGTGTGAAPVVARLAREMDILTVAVVTKPFHFEGPKRMRMAELGLEELQKNVDTLLIIPNQNLFRVANERTTFAEAFAMADDVLHAGVRSITDLMVMPGLINLDFADVRAVMTEMGKAMMGTGEAEGERRAYEAAEAAISNPLLDNASMKGAKGVLINITGGSDMTLFEVDEAANRIREEVDTNANIIFGSTFDDSLEGCIRVSVVATGIDKEIEDDTLPETQEKDRQGAGAGNRLYAQNRPQPAPQEQEPPRGAFSRKPDIPGFRQYNAPHQAARREEQQPQQQDASYRPSPLDIARRDNNAARRQPAQTGEPQQGSYRPREEAAEAPRPQQGFNNGYNRAASDKEKYGFQAVGAGEERDNYGNNTYRAGGAQQPQAGYAPEPQRPSYNEGGDYGYRRSGADYNRAPSGYNAPQEPAQNAGGYGRQDQRSFYNEKEFRQNQQGDDAGGLFSKVAKMARSLQHPPKDENGAQQGPGFNSSRDPQEASRVEGYARPPRAGGKVDFGGAPSAPAYGGEQPENDNRDAQDNYGQNAENAAPKQEKENTASAGSLFDRGNEDDRQEVSEVPAFMRKKTHEHA